MATEPEEFRLHVEAIYHDMTPGFDRLLALDEVEILHFEHQVRTAKEALKRMRGQALLADEVGLGKTVEAGLIMKELLLRGLARRVLILTPAAVVGQWREEMRDKFGEEFLLGRNPEDWKHDRVLASLATAQSDRNAAVILREHYDLLIVDEAHKLKNRATKRFRFVNRIRKKYVLLLTATPVHNDLTELYSLLTILKPGILGTVRRFRKTHVSKEDPRLPARADELRRVLSDVMIRNRRSSTGIKLPPRRAAIYHLPMAAAERALYDDITTYIQEELFAGQAKPARLLTLITLQREVTSSPRALAKTLMAMAERPDLAGKGAQRLHALSATAAALPAETSKVRAVYEILSQFPGKVLIYTDFLETMASLAELLRERGEEVVTFHGGLSTLHARASALEQFRNQARVMISTQSGGEGLNLQFCHQLINFDLPWNPMRVEQRIGRLHRLGQEHPVVAISLSLEGTIEARILDILAHKIRMFELVIGELDLILGEMGEERSFEQIVRELFLAAPDQETLDHGFEQLADRLEHARHRMRHIREADHMLDQLLEA
jgi:SNF2 family DNA or RNA helicase